MQRFSTKLMIAALSAVLLTGGVVTMASPDAVAQGMERGEKGRDGMFKGLNLTPEQQAQMKAIRTETKAQMDAVLSTEQRNIIQNAKQGKGDRRAAMQAANVTNEQKARMKEIHKASRKRIAQVLTPAQKQQIRQQAEGRLNEWLN